MKRKAVIAALLLAAVISLALLLPKGNMGRSAELFALDTYINMTAYGRNAEKALSAAKEHILQREQLWSVNIEGSDIARINTANGSPVTVESSTAELLRFAKETAEKTGGAFDPTVYPLVRAWGFTSGENRVPERRELDALINSVGYEALSVDENAVTLPEGYAADLGAVAKGQLSDDLREMFSEKGVKSAVIDLGGNIVTLGKKPDGSDWNVGVRSPSGEGLLGTVRVSDACVITSGAYERYFIGPDGVKYGHIIDPRTGESVRNGILSVTVIGKEGRLCDALSTALFVMGRDKALDFWKSESGFDMILLTEDGTLSVTEGVYDRFIPGDSPEVLSVEAINR